MHAPLFTKEEQLLATLCRLSPTQPREPSLPQHPISPKELWRELLQNNTYQKILPLLHWKSQNLVEQPIAQQQYLQFPDKLKEKVTNHAKKAWLSSHARKYTFQKIIDLMQQQNIPHLLHKGFVYQDLLYPEPNLRPMGDVDLLLQRQDEKALKKLLLQEGFQFFDFNHSYERFFLHPQSGLNIDVHLDLSDPFASKIQYDQLFQTKFKDSKRNNSLQPAVLFLLHLQHLLKHNLLSGIYTFIEARDLWIMAQPEWDQVLSIAQEWRIKNILDIGLWGLSQLYPGLIPQQQLQWNIGQRLIQIQGRHNCNKKLNQSFHLYWFARHLNVLSAIDNPIDRSRFFSWLVQKKIKTLGKQQLEKWQDHKKNKSANGK